MNEVTRDGEDNEDEVKIPDHNLKQALMDKVGSPITKDKLETITTLNLSGSGINDIEGKYFLIDKKDKRYPCLFN